MKTLLSILLSFFLIAIVSCKKEEPNDDTTSGSGSPSLSTNISGTVRGDNGVLLQGVTLSLNGSSTTSNVDGIFRLENVSIQNGVNFLRAERAGYFSSGRTFYPVQGNEVILDIQLASRNLTGTVNAIDGGEVEDSNGLKVKINPNSIEGGYSGTVSIYTHYIDPTTNRGALEAPGMNAINTESEFGIMRSFGMSIIELEDEDGNLLNLADGEQSELTIPVPGVIQGQAEPTIPLWYFDEVNGTWIEEGQATLEGGNYVGNVGHFTFWNVDKFTCGYVQAVYLGCGEDPLAGATVEFDFDNGVVSAGTATTNSSGFINQAVPCDSELSISLLDPGASGNTFSLGTWTTGEMPEESLELEVECPESTTVVGFAIDALGNPVTNGYVYLSIGDYQSAPAFFNDQGEFEVSAYDFDGTGADAQIVAWDLSTSITVNGPVVPMNNETTVLENPIQITGEAVQPEGLIYVGTDENIFYCLDAENGEEIWTFNTVGTIRSGAVFQDNIVYFGSQDGQTYGINANDGSVIWSQSDGNDNSNYNSFLAVNDLVYFSNGFINGLRARNAQNGVLTWSFDAGSDVQTSPTYDNGIVYSGQDQGLLQAIDATNGQLLWDFEASGDIKSSPAVAEGMVYFGSDNGTW